MQVDGQCHCGRISFTAEIDVGKVALCHCTDCQVLSGAPCRAIASAPIETFVLTGETRTYVKTADSGNLRAQVFCPACGTPIYSSAAENPTSVTLRLGCVRQRRDLVPGANVWKQSALPWLLDPGIPDA